MGNFERPGLSLWGVSHPNDGRPGPKPPSKYTRGLHQRIVQLIEQGQHPETAARACGINAIMFRDWQRLGLEHGPDSGSVLYEFASDIDRACAMAEMGATKCVVEAANDDPKFAAWWLERIGSERWNKTTQVIVRNELESFLEKLEAGLPPHIYEQVLRIATGAAGAVEVGQEDAEVH